MTIENTDFLLVNRANESYKTEYQTIKNDIVGDVSQFPEAPQNSTQYGRQNGQWTPIVHTPAYNDTNVNALLNTNTANAGQVLGWNGGDYYWKNDESGGGGSSADDISYTYPGGVNRTVQARLQDYISVKDFGAVGNGTTDDTIAIRAAINSLQNGQAIYFPKGKYKVTSTLTFQNKGFRMFGDGQQSIIYMAGPANEKLLYLAFNDRNTFWSIQDMVFMAASIPGREFGSAIRLEYNGPGTVIGGSDYLNLINVQIISEITTDSQQGWFKQGLVILNAGGVNAVNLTISSYNLITSGRPGTEGILVLCNKAKNSMIRALHVVNLYIQRYNCCVKVQNQGGANIESIYITQGEIVGYRGFEFDAGQATYLAGLHMDCQEVAYQNTSNGGPHRIIGCDIRGGRDDAGSKSNYLIKLGANNTTLSGCDILCQMPNEGVIQVAPFGTQPEAISITGNVIEGKDDPNYRALEVNAGAKNIKYGGNSYRRFGGGEGRIVDASGGELVVYGQRTGNTP